MRYRGEAHLSLQAAHAGWLERYEPLSLWRKRGNIESRMDYVCGEECMRECCFKSTSHLTEATSRGTNRQNEQKKTAKAACEKT